MSYNHNPADPFNVYFVHLNPSVAAEMLPDALITEGLTWLPRLLINAYFEPKSQIAWPARFHSYQNEPKFATHPYGKYVLEMHEQFDWVAMYVWGLIREAKHRDLPFNTMLVDIMKFIKSAEGTPYPWLPRGKMWDPPQNMPPEFQSRVISSIGCYRRWLTSLHHTHKWTNRVPALWIVPRSKCEAEARLLLEACDLEWSDADAFRSDYDGSDADWALVVDEVNRGANGDDLVSDIALEMFDKCSLSLIAPDLRRGPLWSDAQWHVIKHVATEYANGRDPLVYPANWDMTEYRG